MIRSLALALALALIALPACFKPVSGDYTFTAGEFTSDCPDLDTGGDTGDSTDSTSPVTVSDDKSTMTIGEGDGATECELKGKNFTCPIDPFVFDAGSLGDYDAVSTTTIDLGGHWTSSTSFDTEADFTTDCEGADCESLGLPTCSGTSTGSAELAE